MGVYNISFAYEIGIDEYREFLWLIFIAGAEICFMS